VFFFRSTKSAQKVMVGHQMQKERAENKVLIVLKKEHNSVKKTKEF